MYKWYLPTLSEIIGLSEPIPDGMAGSPAQQRLRAERHWCGAIAALNQMLQQTIGEDVEQGRRGVETDLLPVASQVSIAAPPVHALVLSGPLPVLEQPELVDSVAAWTFTKEPLGAATWVPLHLLPAAEQAIATSATSTLPLLPHDPLAAEQFCLVLTRCFSLVVSLGEVMGETGEQPAFLYSFDPEVVWQCWRSLRSRLMLASPQVVGKLDSLVEQFTPIAPDYRTVSDFSRLMLAHLPEPLEWEVEPPGRGTSQTLAHYVEAAVGQPTEPAAVSAEPGAIDKLSQSRDAADIELLQAIAHEVRTPLSTIRTLTRLLLKRQDLSPDALKRLKLIDQECTAQIDRFNLIFRAVELETAENKNALTALAATSLAQVFQQNVPRWQEQASQRNLTLEVLLPQKLPMVVSDSTMLDQMLMGLFDRITHTLPPGSHIQVRVMLAGHQLKLQFHSQPQKEANGSKSVWTPTLKAIGQLLMFQPETGNLSLNLAATKNLFQALGGKLTVRQRPQEGEVLTVFLPLETRRAEEA